MTRGGCPAPAEVERMYWATRDREPVERDLDLHAHIEGCAACTAQWTAIAGLVALGRTLEPPPVWERREEIRTTLLSTDRAAVVDRATWTRRWLVPAFATAAIVALILWRWPESGVARETSHVSVLDHGSTRWLSVSQPPDESLRLVDGSVTITVTALAAGERFRLITGDGEIEASAAAFDATARDDKLVSVRAIHGTVNVRVAGAHSTLDEGQTWRAATELATAPIDAAPAPVHGEGGVVGAGGPTEDAALVVVRRVTPAEPPVLAPSRERPPIPRAPPEPTPSEPPVTAAELHVDAAPAPAPRSMAQQAFDDGWIALRADDFATAATAFERTVALTNEAKLIEDATFWRAVALARQGKVAVAAHVFTAFLTAYPASPRAHETSVMLGWLLFERGEIADAKRRFEAGSASTSREVRESAQAGLRAVANHR